MLASRGKLDLDAPVAELWPEFGQNGKERATARMMLDHSVGVPALRGKVKDTGPYDWDYMCDRLAAEEPFWVPGTRNGYHVITFGWTVGEMVRRAVGQVARHVLPGRGGGAARPRFLDRPARGASSRGSRR